MYLTALGLLTLWLLRYSLLYDPQKCREKFQIDSNSFLYRGRTYAVESITSVPWNASAGEASRNVGTVCIHIAGVRETLIKIWWEERTCQLLSSWKGLKVFKITIMHLVGIG